MSAVDDFIYEDNSRVTELEKELQRVNAEIEELKLLLRKKDAQLAAESIEPREENDRLDFLEYQIIQLTQVIVKKLTS